MSEGSVFQRKSDGLYCAKYRDASGKWKYLYRSSRADAKQALREALHDRDNGYTPPAKLTVGLYLEEYLDLLRERVSIRTWVSRESIVRRHIVPTLGDKKLANLNSRDVLGLYRVKLSEGLAPSTVLRIHAILTQAMREAVRSKYIRTNPMDDVKPPKQYRQEIDVLSPQQVKRLLETVSGDRYECIIVLGATVGLRIGECLALRYEDVDLAKGTLNIRRTLWCGKSYPTKTPSSRRTLKLPAIALDALTRHIADNNITGGYLFTSRTGNPVDAPSLWRRFKPILERAGLPESLSYHKLRHGAASLLLSQNVPIPVVSNYLGHSNPAITMRVYAHMLPSTNGIAASAIDSLLT